MKLKMMTKQVFELRLTASEVEDLKALLGHLNQQVLPIDLGHVATRLTATLNNPKEGQ